MYEREMTIDEIESCVVDLDNCTFDDFILKCNNYQFTENDVIGILEKFTELLDYAEKEESDLIEKKINLLRSIIVKEVDVLEEEKHIFFSDSFEKDLTKLLSNDCVGDIIDCLHNLKIDNGNSNVVEQKQLSNNKKLKGISELKPRKGNHQTRIYYLTVAPNVYYVFDIEKKKGDMPKSIMDTISSKANNVSNSDLYKSIEKSFKLNKKLNDDFIKISDSKYKEIDTFLNMYKKTGKKEDALYIYQNDNLLKFCMILMKKQINLDDYLMIKKLLENMSIGEIEIIENISKIFADDLIQTYIFENIDVIKSGVEKVI